MQSVPYRFRLCTMMFGQYFIMGMWVVTLATFLLSSPDAGGMNFSAFYVGWIYSTMAIAGIIAPLFIGLLTDTLFASEKLLASMHLAGAILLVTMASWCNLHQDQIRSVWSARMTIETQKSPVPEDLKQIIERINESPEMNQVVDETFYPLLALMMMYALVNVFTLTITTLIALRNVPIPKDHFGQIRLYGTVGWIVAGIMVEVAGRAISATPLYFAGGSSLVMGIFCFRLPHTPPRGEAKTFRESLGLPALKLFLDSSFRVMLVCAFLISVAQQFYSIYANKFLTDLHAPKPAAVQTLAQVLEVVTMASFPFILARLGLKRMMVIGLFGWVVRYGIFATGSMPLVVLCGLPLHGISYTFFFVAASVFVNEKAPTHLKGSAQAISTFMTMGAGTLLGNLLSARIVEDNTLGNVVTWQMVWLIPMAMAGIITLIFWWGFQEDPKLPVVVEDAEPRIAEDR